VTHAFARLRRVGAWAMVIAVLTTGLVTPASLAEAQSAQQKRPNIVFILVDNIGWGTFGVYGGTIPTPRIDKLASEGIRFNNYNVEVQCTLGIPGVGAFKNGRGDFYDYESINGKSVLVRFSIWGITPDTAQSEQAFSDDGGKTWEVNWINRYTRLTEQ
jgi:Sulfatase